MTVKTTSYELKVQAVLLQQVVKVDGVETIRETKAKFYDQGLANFCLSQLPQSAEES